jgi:hypothetical protein
MSTFYVILVVWTIVSSSALCQLDALDHNNREPSAALETTKSCAKESSVIDSKVLNYENKEYLKHSLLIYGLLVSITKDDVSTTCFAHVQKIIQGIKVKESWALKGKLSE